MVGRKNSNEEEIFSPKWKGAKIIDQYLNFIILLFQHF